MTAGGFEDDNFKSPNSTQNVASIFLIYRTGNHVVPYFVCCTNLMETDFTFLCTQLNTFFDRKINATTAFADIVFSTTKQSDNVSSVV